MDSKDWKLVAKYLSGNLEGEEIEYFDDWRKLPGNEQSLEEFERIWKESDKILTVEELNADAEWENIRDLILHGFHKESRVKVSPLGWVSTLAKIAASVTIVIVGYLVIRNLETNEVNSLAVRYPGVEMQALSELLATNSVTRYYLPDGSMVWLNKHSKISFPKKFEGAERVFFLKGEAYFEVIEDTSRVFIVNAKETQIKVLGTSFNIDAYNAHEGVRLIVSDGEVLFTATNQPLETVLLTAGEKGVYSSDSSTVEKMINDNPDYLSWKGESPHPAKIKRERSPESYLHNTFYWRKNVINQSVMEGEIYNTSLTHSFKNIEIKYVISTNKIAKKPRIFVIKETVGPGRTISYKHSLLDIFTKTSRIDIEIISAEIADN